MPTLTPPSAYATRINAARKALRERRAAEVAALTAYSKAHALAIKTGGKRPHIDQFVSRK